MADRKPPRTPLVLSPEALFRYQILDDYRRRVLARLVRERRADPL
jgi:hypothetical protein